MAVGQKLGCVSACFREVYNPHPLNLLSETWVPVQQCEGSPLLLSMVSSSMAGIGSDREQSSLWGSGNPTGGLGLSIILVTTIV